jgi:hypothetical protein
VASLTGLLAQEANTARSHGPTTRRAQNRAHGDGTTSGLHSGTRVTLRSVYQDGFEMVEELDATSKELLVRRWKAPAGPAQAAARWEYELGEAPAAAAAGGAAGALLLRESSSAMTWLARDAGAEWHFVVRNSAFPLNVFHLSVEGDSLVLRTSNKKFFKRWTIPSLQRAGRQPEGHAVQLVTAAEGLVVRYRKPQDLHRAELEERKKRLQSVASSLAGGGGKDADCKTQ